MQERSPFDGKAVDARTLEKEPGQPERRTRAKCMECHGNRSPMPGNESIKLYVYKYLGGHERHYITAHAVGLYALRQLARMASTARARARTHFTSKCNCHTGSHLAVCHNILFATNLDQFITQFNGSFYWLRRYGGGQPCCSLLSRRSLRFVRMDLAGVWYASDAVPHIICIACTIPSYVIEILPLYTRRASCSRLDLRLA